MATFADDTTVMAIGETIENSTTAISCQQNRYLDKKMVNKTQQIQISTY
jgi:hypothetical protein